MGVFREAKKQGSCVSGLDCSGKRRKSGSPQVNKLLGELFVLYFFCLLGLKWLYLDLLLVLSSRLFSLALQEALELLPGEGTVWGSIS